MIRTERYDHIFLFNNSVSNDLNGIITKPSIPNNIVLGTL